MVFTESNSSYSQELERLMKSHHEVREYNVRIQNVDSFHCAETIRRSLMSLTGQATLPHVWMNGKYIGGSIQTRRALHCGHVKYFMNRS